jgi:hypothetical protein
VERAGSGTLSELLLTVRFPANKRWDGPPGSLPRKSGHLIYIRSYREVRIPQQTQFFQAIEAAKMGRKGVEDSLIALLRAYHSRAFCEPVSRHARSWKLSSPSRSLVTARSGPSPSGNRCATSAAVENSLSTTQSRNLSTTRQRTDAPAEVAVIGAGITGLTTAYYLAKKLPETSRITVYESKDGVGGWLHTVGMKIKINDEDEMGYQQFERGPRTLRGFKGDTWRFDDLVLYDLVCLLPSRLFYMHLVHGCIMLAAM